VKNSKNRSIKEGKKDLTKRREIFFLFLDRGVFS